MCELSFYLLKRITAFYYEPIMSPSNVYAVNSIFATGIGPYPWKKTKLKNYTTFMSSCGFMRFKVMPFGMVISSSM